MVYTPQYNDWYCYQCQKYPLSFARYGYAGAACTAKSSVLRLISMITIALMIITIILFLIGLTFIHAELTNYFEDLESSNNKDYYDDYDYTEYRPEDLIKGTLDMGIAIIILLCTRAFLGFTINNPPWWKRLKMVMEGGCSWNMESARMKRTVSDLYGLFYGTVIILGTLLFIYGIIFLNITETAMIFVACGDVLISILIIFTAYKLYIREITRLSKEIYPLLEPKVPNTPKRFNDAP